MATKTTKSISKSTPKPAPKPAAEGGAEAGEATLRLMMMVIVLTRLGASELGVLAVEAELLGECRQADGPGMSSSTSSNASRGCEQTSNSGWTCGDTEKITSVAKAVLLGHDTPRQITAILQVKPTIRCIVQSSLLRGECCLLLLLKCCNVDGVIQSLVLLLSLMSRNLAEVHGQWVIVPSVEYG